MSARCSARLVLGVDVGGVIISRADDNADTSFFADGYLSTPPVPGCLDALRALVEFPFGKDVHIVSKCGENVERRTREWLVYHDVYRLTGIQSDHVHFTRTREGKAPICERLGVSHFVDDRLDVLLYMATVAHRYLLVAGNPARLQHADAPEGIGVADSWLAALALIRGSAALNAG